MSATRGRCTSQRGSLTFGRKKGETRYEDPSRPLRSAANAGCGASRDPAPASSPDEADRRGAAERAPPALGRVVDRSHQAHSRGQPRCRRGAPRPWPTRRELIGEVFDYIEIFLQRDPPALEAGPFWVQSSGPRGTVKSDMSSIHRTSQTPGTPMTPRAFHGKEGVAGSSQAEGLIGDARLGGFLGSRAVLATALRAATGPSGSAADPEASPLETVRGVVRPRRATWSSWDARPSTTSRSGGPYAEGHRRATACRRASVRRAIARDRARGARREPCVWAARG